MAPPAPGHRAARDRPHHRGDPRPVRPAPHRPDRRPAPGDPATPPRHRPGPAAGRAGPRPRPAPRHAPGTGGAPDRRPRAGAGLPRPRGAAPVRPRARRPDRPTPARRTAGDRPAHPHRALRRPQFQHPYAHPAGTHRPLAGPRRGGPGAAGLPGPATGQGPRVHPARRRSAPGRRGLPPALLRPHRPARPRRRGRRGPGPPPLRPRRGAPGRRDPGPALRLARGAPADGRPADGGVNHPARRPGRPGRPTAARSGRRRPAGR
ncbi:hypothetical protein SGPA1_20070 [Streptomyces misionensis JCM 4497]